MLIGTIKARKIFLRELELEREKMLLGVDRKIAEEYKIGAEQRHDYECTWHSEKEDKVVVLAELQGKINALNEQNKDRDALIVEKDARITELQTLVQSLIEKVGQQPIVNVLQTEKVIERQ